MMEKDKILYNLWLIYRSNPNSPWLREYYERIHT